MFKSCQFLGLKSFFSDSITLLPLIRLNTIPTMWKQCASPMCQSNVPVQCASVMCHTPSSHVCIYILYIQPLCGRYVELKQKNLNKIETFVCFMLGFILFLFLSTKLRTCFFSIYSTFWIHLTPDAWKCYWLHSLKKSLNWKQICTS